MNDRSAASDGEAVLRLGAVIFVLMNSGMPMTLALLRGWALLDAQGRRSITGNCWRGTAALLSFIWPGLGQLYARRRRSALLFAVPAFALAAVVLFQARRGLAVLMAQLLDPSV